MFYTFSSMKISILLIIVFDHWKIISSESIENLKLSNINQDLSLKVHQQKVMETHPLHEGFILLSNENKKSQSIELPLVKSSNISTTTTTCTTVLIITKKRLSSSRTSVLDHSISYLGRKLLNEPSYDTDVDIISKKNFNDNEWEMNDLIKTDVDEELSKQLFRFETTMDGSGDTTEETTIEQTSDNTRISTDLSTIYSTISTTLPVEFSYLSNNSAFILTINCPNANDTLNQILNELTKNFGSYQLYNQSEAQCNGSNRINVTLNILTDGNIQIQNNLFANLLNISKSKGVDVYSNNRCGNNGIVPVINVTSCYLIDLCRLCGHNPIRGVCIPTYNESKCECLPNKNDSSKPYTGDLCYPSDLQSITPSTSSRGTFIIIGVLSGLAGLFCIITVYLWAIAAWRRRRSKNFDLRIHRLWHLPRAQIPASITSNNIQSYFTKTNSTSSSRQSDFENDRSITSNSTFFKELDQKMGENLRATISRPNSSALLASLPSSTISNASNYDPIDELDSIIDNEDISMILHDPFNDENESFETINPLFK